MSEDIKNTQPVNDSELEGANGGYVGHDKFTTQEYSQAGVAWESNVWSRDKYYFNGVRISQKCAEKMTAYAIGQGRPCTQEEFEKFKAKYD